MLVVIGSSSKLAEGIHKVDKNAIYIGRSNSFEFKNWIQGGDLSSTEGVDRNISNLQQILNTNLDQSAINLVLLNGISSNNWELSISINMFATAKIVEQFSIYLKEKNLLGSVVLIGSSSSYLGGKIPYSMTKASLVGLMNSVNAQYSPNVRVNMVLPGAIESGMTEDWGEEKKSKISQTTYQNRLASADEIVNAIIFCAQNTYLSGVIINMTSGVVKI